MNANVNKNFRQKLLKVLNVGKTVKSSKRKLNLESIHQRNPTVSLQVHPKTHDHLLPDCPNADC